MKLNKEELNAANLGRQQTPEQKPRFQIVKLEERIAPHRCHYNPHGKKVGCGRHRGYY